MTAVWNRMLSIIREQIGSGTEYRIELKPCSSLEDVIHKIWIRTTSEKDLKTTWRKVLPNGGINIIFPLKGHATTSAYAVSSHTRPAVLQLEGPQESIGIQLKPLGAARVFPFPMHEIETYYSFALEDIFPDVSILEEKLRDGKSLRRKVSLIEEFLAAKKRDSSGNRRILPILRKIIRCGGIVDIDRLCSMENLSHRQIQRDFQRYIGVSPYRYGRIVRFLNSCIALKRPHFSSADIAQETGYADQSHFIREFRFFSGLTPSQFAGNEVQRAGTREIRLYDTFPVQNPYQYL